jgi:hypothetical protein
MEGVSVPAVGAEEYVAEAYVKPQAEEPEYARLVAAL